MIQLDGKVYLVGYFGTFIEEWEDGWTTFHLPLVLFDDLTFFRKIAQSALDLIV